MTFSLIFDIAVLPSSPASILLQEVLVELVAYTMHISHFTLKSLKAVFPYVDIERCRYIAFTSVLHDLCNVYLDFRYCPNHADIGPVKSHVNKLSGHGSFNADTRDIRYVHGDKPRNRSCNDHISCHIYAWK